MTTAEKLTKVAENRQKLYDAGMQAEYDAFWDMYQQNGNRDQYGNAFNSYAWCDEIFRPKYDIRGINMNAVFCTCQIVDVEACLQKAGVVLDYSLCTSPGSCKQILTYNYKCKVFPEVDISNVAGTIGECFSNATALETLRKLILSADGSQSFNNTFYNAKSLKNIEIEGVIGNDISFAQSPLSKASMESIVNALSDTAEGKTVTFSANAKANAFTDEEWEALTATKENWTFRLLTEV